jgi:hypothetical protein
MLAKREYTAGGDGEYEFGAGRDATTRSNMRRTSSDALKWRASPD